MPTLGRARPAPDPARAGTSGCGRCSARTCARYDTPRGTVEGVSFAVWAPNARGVKVTGDFDYWEARAYPMRSLGSSGVWEIFIPGVAGRQPLPVPRARRRRHVAGEGRPDGLRHRGAAR